MTLEQNRTLLKATGVEEVEGFDEKTVLAMIDGFRMTVKGKELKVSGFSVEDGELTVEGCIDGISYSPALSRRAGILAKVFR